LVVLVDKIGFALTLCPALDGELLSYSTGPHLGFNPDNVGR